MEITKDIRYIGVNDHEIDLFESQYIVPLGMAYNSYVILDEKIAVMDSVDARFGTQWLANLDAALEGRKPDYLVVQHMEPDHSANIVTFMNTYPEAVVVATAKAFTMMQQFFGTSFAGRSLTVKEGSTLELGRHTLSFITAPMVHWPEVIMSYDSADKVLFSADAFGKFGANDVEDPEGWACEARRYYFGIVGKYGGPVQTVLKKAAKLDIQTVCPLHGPVLSGEELAEALRFYGIWSAYQPESRGVTIACCSVYGHTMEAAAELKGLLEARGVQVKLFDLARDDMAEAVESAFQYDRLVLAATTYNNDVFPFMRSFIEHLTERVYQNRRVAIVENGSWAPNAAKVMVKLLEGSKNLTMAETTVTIKGGLNDASRAQLSALAEEFAD